MDPNATLEKIRAIVKDRYDDFDAMTVRSLMTLIASLDSWLTRGGFAPPAWTTAPSSGLEGAIGLVGPDLLQVGDILLFPARELWTVEDDGLHVTVSDGYTEDELEPNGQMLIFRPQTPRSRRDEGCPTCAAAANEGCHMHCDALASLDEDAHAYLEKLGLTSIG